MKTIYCNLLVLLLLVSSCQSGDKSATDESVKEKDVAIYQMEVYQKSQDDFKIIYLNKLNGTIYVRENNGYWFDAQQVKKLKSYKKPSYSFKIFNGDNQFQIALINEVTGEIFVRSYSSSWYDASRVTVVK